MRIRFSFYVRNGITITATDMVKNSEFEPKFDVRVVVVVGVRVAPRPSKRPALD